MKFKSIFLSILLILFILSSSFIIFIKIEDSLKLKTSNVKDIKDNSKKDKKEKTVKEIKQKKGKNNEKEVDKENNEKKENLIEYSIINKYIFLKNFLFESKKISTLMLMFFLIMSIFIVFLLTKIFDGPLNKLDKSIEEINNGDFTIRLPAKGKSKLAKLYKKFNSMIKDISKKIVIQKYVSKSTAEMLENIKTGEFTSGPQRKNITVFFSDIRGFTSFSEKNDPLIVVNRLNELFDVQVKIIARNSGDIDKFVGDSIMAIFPTPQKAFKASLDIQKKISEFNKKKKLSLNIGIGVNYGEAVVGAIGSGDSYNWTTIGDTVNLASRLCSIAEGGTICISKNVLKKIKTRKRPKEKKIKIKGINKPVTVYVLK